MVVAGWLQDIAEMLRDLDSSMLAQLQVEQNQLVAGRKTGGCVRLTLWIHLAADFLPERDLG